jgi:hypothetical protein
MAQIQKGTTYSTGDQVTATNLNALADAAILLPGAITDQTAKTVPLAADTVLIYSAADTALRKSTLTQLFASPQPIGATTASTGAFTTISASGVLSLNSTSIHTVNSLNFLRSAGGYNVLYAGTNGLNINNQADTAAIAAFSSTGLAVTGALTTTGNVGIGVTPSAWYSTVRAIQFGTSGTVEGRSNNTTYLSVGTNYYLNGSAANTYIATAASAKYEQDAGVHKWYNAASGTAGNAITFTQAMTLDASGNFGIGTTTPAYRLVVDHTTSLGIAVTRGGKYIGINANAAGSNTYSYIEADAGMAMAFNTNGANERVRISSAGAVRFNTYGAGALTTDASGNITAASDERIKSNIRPFSRGLSEILAINPILHGYTEESGLDQSRNDYAGFSAQQVQPLIPEAIGENANGMLSFSDRPVMAALVNAMKELNANLVAELQSLRQRVAALESK